MNSVENLVTRLSNIKIDKSNPNKSFKEIQKIYFEIFRHYKNDIRQTQLKAGSKLYRVRKNFNDLRFEEPQELFTPPSHLTYFGRCNLVRNPVYYCSDNSNTAILESKLKEGDCFTLIESTLLDDCKIVIAGNCSRYKSSTPESAMPFNNIVTEYFNQEINDPLDYLPTSTLSDVLLSDQSVHGIMYPSIYSQKKGDNFALRNKDLNKKLMFEYVRQFKVIKLINKNNLMIKCIGKSDRISVTGNFLWEKVLNCENHEINFDNNELILK